VTDFAGEASPAEGSSEVPAKEDAPDPALPNEPAADAWDSALQQAYAAREAAATSVLMQSIHLRAGRKVQVALRDLHGDAPPLRLQRRGVDWSGGGEGRYRNLGELARGGVGVVLVAHDNDIGRDVAVKVLHEEHADDPAMLQRFVEEAQIGGQLQHPGIVPVYELGLDLRQRPYFTMKLVQGETLAAQLDRRRDPGDDAARLLTVFARVCETVAFAHARGVVHRDLKPGNVMVGEFGEVLVMDWGFAKVLGRGEAARPAARVATASDTSASVAGTILGTPAYMPPEQAAGDVDRLDARADVFALGAILGQILTGRPPYVGDELLAQARTALLEPAHARLAACGADPVLIAVARRCLQRDAAMRPASAKELAEALAAHFASVDERAERARIEAAAAKARAAEERKRRRLAVALGLTALAAILAAAALYVGYGRQVESTGREASAALARAWQHVAAGDLVAAAGAVEQARTALRAGTPDATTTASVADAEARVRRLKRDEDIERRVLRALLPGAGAEGRLPVDDVVAALGESGVDVRASPRAIAAQVEGLDTAASPVLLRALHELALRPAQDHALATENLLAAADLLDQDAERTRVRAACAAHDPGELRELRTELSGDATPAATLELLGMALLAEGAQTEAIAVLTAAHEHAPDSFWINHRLAFLYRVTGRHEESHMFRELAGMAHPLARFGFDPRDFGPGPGGRGRGPPPNGPVGGPGRRRGR